MKDITPHDLQVAKAQLEARLLEIVGREVEAFTAATGVQVSGADFCVQTIRFTTLEGTTTSYVVGNIKLDVQLKHGL